jgi:hypothetical protein
MDIYVVSESQKFSYLLNWKPLCKKFKWPGKYGTARTLKEFV